MSRSSDSRMSVEQLFSTKWTVPILQNLLGGPTRFSDLRGRIPDVSPTLLTRRLRDLEQKGLIERIYLPPPADRQAYTLTLRDATTRNVLEAIRALSERWGDAPSDVVNHTEKST